MKIKLTEQQFRRIMLQEEEGKNNIIKNPITTLYHGTSNYRDLSMSTLKIKRDTSMYTDDALKTSSLYETCYGIYLTRTTPSGDRGYGNPRMYAITKWADYVKKLIKEGNSIIDAFTTPKALIYEVKLKDDVKLSDNFDGCVTEEELNDKSSDHYGFDGFQGQMPGGGYETVIWDEDKIESIKVLEVGSFEFSPYFKDNNPKRFKGGRINTTNLVKIAKGHSEDIGKIVWS